MGYKKYRFANSMMGGIVKKEFKVSQRVTKEEKQVEQTKSLEDMSKDELKEVYESKSGEKAHHLWKEPRLIEEIQKLD